MIPTMLNPIGINKYAISGETHPEPLPPVEYENYTVILSVYDNITENILKPPATEILIESPIGVSPEISSIGNTIQFTIPLRQIDTTFEVMISAENHYKTIRRNMQRPTSGYIMSEAIYLFESDLEYVENQAQNFWTTLAPRDFDTHLLIVSSGTENSWQCASYGTTTGSEKHPWNFHKSGNSFAVSEKTSSGDFLISCVRDAVGSQGSSGEKTTNEAFIYNKDLSSYNFDIYPIIIDYDGLYHSGYKISTEFYDKKIEYNMINLNGDEFFNRVTNPEIIGGIWIVGKHNTKTDEITLFNNMIAMNKNSISTVIPELTPKILNALKLQ